MDSPSNSRPDSARNSDRILAEARASLTLQRGGGRRSIGRRAAEMKRRHQTAKLTRLLITIGAILLAAIVAGLILDGIGILGLFITVLATVAAFGVLTQYPKMSVPSLDALNTGDVKTMVGRTELWLEAQRPALPPPAVRLVDQIGVQLDALGAQLEGLRADEPAAGPVAGEVRRLVGEHLPGMVASYRKIPAHLRAEERGGRNADQQLVDGLGKISAEIDGITRQLAAGDLDALAVQTRYLDYAYGGGIAGEQAALPAPDLVLPASGVPLNFAPKTIERPKEPG